MKKKDYLKCESKIKYLVFLLLYILLYIPSFLLYHRKNIWLICERGIDAQDNGFVFYKYLKKNHKEIKVYYLITTKSRDKNKIEKKDIVQFCSIKHFLMVIGCKVQISSHLFGYCPWSSFMLYLRRHKTKNIHVFLQHGITYNNQFGYYKNVCKALSLYICGSSKEQEYICDTFGYKLEEAPLTGFARYDNLHDKLEKKYLLIMPTWRRYLSGISKKDFVESIYFKKWYSLLNNNSIHKLCANEGLEPVFYLHLSLQPFSELFSDLKNVRIVKYGEETVQEMLKQSSVLITDYSSVMFDCLYMEKDVLLFQFDKDAFIENHYAEGFFNELDRNVLPVETSESKLIGRLENLFSNNDSLKQTYSKKYSNEFFGIKDQNNCTRIFEIIQSKL